jgi:hypothetical protein
VLALAIQAAQQIASTPGKAATYGMTPGSSPTDLVKQYQQYLVSQGLVFIPVGTLDYQTLALLISTAYST